MQDDSPSDTLDERLARRREQLRLAQQRRRQRLAQGQKTEVNVFLSKDALARLDALALLWGVDRQEVLERLLRRLQVEARAVVEDGATGKDETGEDEAKHAAGKPGR